MFTYNKGALDDGCLANGGQGDNGHEENGCRHGEVLPHGFQATTQPSLQSLLVNLVLWGGDGCFCWACHIPYIYSRDGTPDLSHTGGLCRVQNQTLKNTRNDDECQNIGLKSTKPGHLFSPTKTALFGQTPYNTRCLGCHQLFF